MLLTDRLAPHRSLPPKNLSPRVVLERLPDTDRRVFVVRDDLLPGGSKQRACEPLLNSLAMQGYTHFVYASPFCGFAQVALAFACQNLGLTCKIYCERTPEDISRDPKHEFARVAEFYGAAVQIVPSLADAESMACLEERRSPRNFKIPLGFDCDEFKNAFEIVIREQWRIVCEILGGPPSTLWLPVGSGTLCRVFSRIVQSPTQIKCVDVHVLPKDDGRIQALKSEPNITIRCAPEKFFEAARHPPSIPSNQHYDAKMWQFLSTEARDGDLWWNVAR